MTTEATAADVAGTTTAVADAPVETMTRAEAQKIIAERDRYKAQVKELSPAAQKLKDLEDAQKSEVQRLSDENATLKTKADRADALTLAVQETFDAEVATLTDAQKAAIVGDTPDAKLRHLRALRAAGMLGQATKPPVPGGGMPGGGNGAVPQSAVPKMSNEARAKLYQDVREGKRTIIPD